MADNSEIQVSITASVAGLVSGMREAANTVQASAQTMNTAFSGLTGVIGKIGGAVAAVSAVLAGGKMFGHVVSETVEWNKEAMDLARTLGITTEQASILNVALGDIYTSTDTYTRAAMMMTRQIASGGDGLKRLGLSAKDANGNLKPSGELMQEVIEKLATMGEGTNRNAAGVAVFGRSWQEASKLVKLTGETMEEAKKKAEQLGLVVWPSQVEQTKAYRAAMNDFDDSLKGLSLTVGSKVLPIITQMAQMFADEGPSAVQKLGNAFSWFAQILVGAWTLIRKGTEYLASFLSDASAFGTAYVKIMQAAVKLDFQGVKKAWADFHISIEDNARTHAATMKLIEDETTESMQRAMGIGPKSKTTKKEGPSGRFDVDKNKDNGDERIREWDAALKKQEEAQALMAARNGQFWERDLSEEAAYWQKKLGLSDLSDKERITIEEKVSSLKIESYRKDLEAKKAALDAEMIEERNNLGRKLELAKQEQAMYQAGSKGYEEARKKTIGVEKEIQDQLAALQKIHEQTVADAALHLTNMEEEQIGIRRNLGILNDRQEIAALMDLESKRFAIKLKAAKDEAALELNPVKRAEDLRKIEQLEQTHALTMAKLNGNLTKSMTADFKTFFDGMTSGFSVAVKGLVNGTMSWSNAFKTVLQSALDFFVDMCVKMGLTWVSNQLMEMIYGKATAASQISANAGIAASGAMASVAAIPFVGWAMAPEVGASTFASAMAYMGSLASAAGGWETVPSDQLAMVHKNEQILPAKYAQGLRDLIGGRDQAQQSAPSRSGDTYHVAIHAMDAKSMESALRRNQGGILKVLGEAARNGRAK